MVDRVRLWSVLAGLGGLVLVISAGYAADPAIERRNRSFDAVVAATPTPARSLDQMREPRPGEMQKAPDARLNEMQKVIDGKRLNEMQADRIPAATVDLLRS